MILEVPLHIIHLLMLFRSDRDPFYLTLYDSWEPLKLCTFGAILDAVSLKLGAHGMLHGGIRAGFVEIIIPMLLMVLNTALSSTGRAPVSIVFRIIVPYSVIRYSRYLPEALHFPLQLLHVIPWEGHDCPGQVLDRHIIFHRLWFDRVWSNIFQLCELLWLNYSGWLHCFQSSWWFLLHSECRFLTKLLFFDGYYGFGYNPHFLRRWAFQFWTLINGSFLWGRRGGDRGRFLFLDKPRWLLYWLRLVGWGIFSNRSHE